MNKKLLIIGSSLNYGAPGRITENIGRIAKQEGWVVYQAHGLRYSRQSELNTYPVSSKYEELRHFANSFFLDGHGLSSTKATIKFIKWIEKIKPDIIHLHNLHGYFINIKLLFDFLRDYNCPVVWTLHDFWPITGHCVHFDYIGCDKWQRHCMNCPQIHSYPTSLLIDRASRNFELKQQIFTSLTKLRLVAVSNWVKKIYKESFLGGMPIQTIYNGVNTQIFAPQNSNLREKLNVSDKYILLGVASPWYKLKGFEDFINLSKVLSSEYQIIMVGVNKKQIKRLPSHIIGIEYVESQRELAKFYSMANTTLNLSYQETFGMTTIEGLSCGTPGIVYNKTASPELVSSDTGKVVEAGNIQALQEAIQELKYDTRYIDEKCRNRVIELFDENKQIKKYIELYNSLL